MPDPVQPGQPVHLGRLPDESRRLTALASKQCGVFTVAQARELGFSARATRRRVASGIWVRHGRALGMATAGFGDCQEAWAAVLAGGPGAILTGTLAARLQGAAIPKRRPLVIVPVDRHIRAPGVGLLRVPVSPFDLSVGGVPPMTSRDRALIDEMMRAPWHVAAAIVDRAVQERWLSVEDLVRRTKEFSCRTGNPKLRLLADRAASGGHSEAEHRLIGILRQAGIEDWSANLTVRDAFGHLVAIIDVAFEGAKPAVEVDGRQFHTAEDRFRRDRTRQNALVNLGWTVLRFTWYDLVDQPRYVVATIEAALSQRRRARSAVRWGP